MQAIETQGRNTSYIERLGSPESLFEAVIREQFDVLKKHAHPITGLWPAVEPGVGRKEAYEEDHMQDAWIRDSSMNLIGLIESAAILKRLDPESVVAGNIGTFVKEDIGKLLGFFNKDENRWAHRFRQAVIVNEEYSTLIDREHGGPGAPEVHLKTDGSPCEWPRQNQPDSWAELLIALGRAKETGIIDKYEKPEMDFIERVAGYLDRIQPWKFECTGMWEDPEVRTPTSRSTALIIAKGLEGACSLLDDEKDATFKKQLRHTIEMIMIFVESDPNTDRTSPKHSDGADLAMAIAEALPGTEATRLPSAEYISTNAERLSIGIFPAAKRHIEDDYYRNENVAIGEARWFISNPTLVIDFAQATRVALNRGEWEKAAEYFNKADFRFNQTLDVLTYHGYPWELATPTHPDNVRPGDRPWREMDPVENVVLVPLERSLLWNRSFIAWAAAEVAFVRNNIEQFLDGGITFVPDFFHNVRQQEEDVIEPEKPRRRWRLLSRTNV